MCPLVDIGLTDLPPSPPLAAALLFHYANNCFLVNLLIDLFLAQQWRLTKEGKLQNRLRNWAYSNKKETKIPGYGQQGIINISKKFGHEKTLTFPFPGRGNVMTYKTEFSGKSRQFQMWEIGFPKDGWFNISSAKAKNKYLTVTKIDNIHQLTMEIDGTVFSI